MCGIYGRLDLRGNGIERLPADRAGIAALRHRGPDDEGVWYGSRACLGMRRLSVIDLATGHQPIANEDGTVVVVYNGEIYNFQEVRDELVARGHQFTTVSDTEVIVHGYEEWGDAVLDRLNGMFAIALFDERRDTLLIARDRLGVKPLYYYVDDRRLVFASEIKAILCHGDIPREIDSKGLLNYLAYGHAVAPDTIYRGIKKLLPGHTLTVRGRDLAVRRWWTAIPPPPTTMSEEECAREVRRLLEDSVRLRMIADVPVGAFLSGGLDSSAVVALMAQHTQHPVQTFSVGFANLPAFNELPDARRVAAHCRTSHHEVVVESRDLIRTIETLVYHFDEPFGDAACFPTYLVSRLAREHVTVALTGEGGDEAFGGYRRYWAARWIRLLRLVTGGVGPAAVGLAVDRLPRLRRLKKIVEAARVADPAARYASMLRVFSDDALRHLVDARLESAVAAYDAREVYRRHFADAGAADELNALMYVDMKTWLADTYLEKVDKTSMAVSLEARVPLLDYRLVEFSMRIPSRYKITRSDSKRVFKNAVRDLLPPETLQKAKHGFAVPTDSWFRGELRDFAYDVLLDRRSRQRGFFDAAAVERLWRDHQSGREVRDTHLWLLMNFELWAREYLDQRMAA
ncbi:MAG TPA: asparagine synthase (glutamine-hydrolyzing) [Vicinamibacterales bacterium]|nr:asparagine synthase (glutamine-hydrolyzing) [Vicinamibacterales bacterium]